MEHIGESQEDNNLFYLCSLIDFVARETKNKRKDIVNLLGYETLHHIWDYGDIYHCMDMHQVIDENLDGKIIKEGTFDNVKDCIYDPPTFWTMGRVYQRLIKMISEKDKKDVIQVLIDVYNSWIADVIDDYNCDMFYQNTDYQYYSYEAGYLLD